MSYKIVHSLTQQQIYDLVELYQHEWFSQGRRLDDVRKMLAGTDLTIGFCDQETDKLVAFVRAMTDTVYKAFIFDVIVSDPYRGQGLGRMLMETLLAHPLIKDIPHIELYCPERFVPFYHQFGFEKRDSILLRKK